MESSESSESSGDLIFQRRKIKTPENAYGIVALKFL